MKLKTKRLLLRPQEMRDARDLVEGIGNIEVSKWLLVVPYPYTMKDAKKFITRNKKKLKEDPKTGYNFGIILREEDKLIGGIGIHHLDKFQGKGEIGYWLNADYHRQGYGSEALEAVLDFAFQRLKLRRLEAGVFAGNPSSGKLLEKFGFKHEGTKVQGAKCRATGEINDELLYGLLRENYKEEFRK